MSTINNITQSVAEWNRLKWLYVVAGIGLLLYPITIGSQSVFLGITIMSYCIFAVSFNLIYGYMGEVPFGHAAFFGLGAYAAGITVTRFGLPYPLALVMGFIIPVVISVIFSIFATKLIAIYFSIFSLAFGEAVRGILLSMQNITKGTLGLTFQLPAYFQSSITYYYFVLGLTLTILYTLRRLINSPFGVMIRSVKNSEQRLHSLGVNPRKIKIMNLTVAGGTAGIAGALFAPAASVLFPNLAGWKTGSVAIWSTLVGGPGVFIGPILGAVLYEPMRTTAIQFTEHWPIIEGVVLLIILLIAPKGLAGIFSDITDRLQQQFNPSNSRQNDPGRDSSEDLINED